MYEREVRVMGYVFKGRLCGYICPECPEPLSNVKIRLYRSRNGQKISALASAQPKETFGILDREQVEEKSQYLIAEVAADDNGRFLAEFGDMQDYKGEPFEIDVYLETVPRYKGKPASPLQFTVTMLQPRWRETEDGFVASWEYCLPCRMWCAIRARFGAWVICGSVVVCNKKVPVAGVRVRAFDVDLIQDDPLGEAITDASGRFRIDYTTSDFRQTPLSPFVNIEWVEGPDVYFRVETPTGSPLLEEPRMQGRTPGRENVGPCFCVRLCLDEIPTHPEPQTIPLFTHVGQYKVDSNPALSDFASDGTTKTGGYAFTETIPLIGLLPDGTASDPVEYRFRYAMHPALAPVENADGNVIGRTVIGQLEYFAWNSILSAWVVKSADYWVNHPGAPVVSIPQPAGPALSVPVNKPIAPDGWIRVPTENELFPGGKGRFVPTGRLANMDTEKLTNESFNLTVSVPPLPLKAGDTVPAAQRSESPKFRIFFEARKVATAVPVNSNQLDVIAMSNTSYTYVRHPGWAGGTVTTTAVVSLEIAEMTAPGSSGCDTLSEELHALFTVYHPYLAEAKVYFEGNPPLPAPHIAAITGGEALAGAPGVLFDISLLDPCAYILWLRATLNLTRGWGRIAIPWIWDKIAFCVGKNGG